MLPRHFIALLLVFIVPCSAAAQVIPVSINKTETGFQLLRGGEPYFIKGAGGFDFPERLASYGGNSTRTWGTDMNTIALLNDAHARGISVMMGLWVMHEAHGFNYNDPVAVKKQLDDFKALVEMYKDHPAVLAWGIGNEVELGLSTYNLNVWNAINDISKMIHEVDGNHPTLTVTAGIDQVKAGHILERAPDLDILGVNAYGGISGVFNTLKSTPGFDKPVIITEWGPNGQWEVPKTSFGVPIEQTSTEKAASYKQRYEQVILANNSVCLGSYVFLWSNKIEETPTWYGLFLPTGEETETVDVMQYSWKGVWPENRAPQIQSASVLGKTANQSVVITEPENNTAKVLATDPEGDPLTYEFLILPAIGFDGTVSSPPASFPYLPALIKQQNANEIAFSAPEDKKSYRLYAIVRDNHNNVAVANVPFHVDLLPLVSNDPAILFTVRDAYVRDGSFATEAFGSTDELRLVTRKADEGSNRSAFIEFDLNSIDEGFDNVTLELFGNSQQSAQVTASYSTEAVWAEHAITWNNMPALPFSPADTTTVLGQNYFAWNITFPIAVSLAHKKRFITFRIDNLTGTSSTISWNSREMRLNPPRLVFSFNGRAIVTQAEKSIEKEYSIAPNPAKQKSIDVYSSNGAKAQLRVYDLNGREMLSKVIEGKVTTLPLNQLPAGVYTVQIQKGKTAIYRKIVLE